MGSVRPGNYTSMAAALVMDELTKNPKVSVELIDPAELELPLPGTDPNAEATKWLHSSGQPGRFAAGSRAASHPS